MSCIVVGCKSHSSRKENDAKIISFHRFPSDVDMRQKLINAIARNNWEWKKQHRICSKHFSDDCFNNIGHKWRRLKIAAVPSLHLRKEEFMSTEDFTNGNEECRSLRDANSKLEIELREVRELEKSHRYHLATTREMIRNLQETVSHLVYLKRDVKKLEEKLASKEAYLVQMEKDKEITLLKHNENIVKIQADYEKEVVEIKADNCRKIQQIQDECDEQVAQFTCVAEELRAKMRDMETVNRDKISIVVLEYEEKLQRATAEVSQLQEQLSRETARSDLNINAYKRRLEELEEKLKQSQFKQYLRHSSEYESQAETPCSVTRDCQEYSLDVNPIQDKVKVPLSTQRKPLKSTNSLQVNFYNNKSEKTRQDTFEEKRDLFHITKKRKLFNAKEFHDV